MNENIDTTPPPSDEDMDDLQKEVALALHALQLAHERVDDDSEEFKEFNDPDMGKHMNLFPNCIHPDPAEAAKRMICF